MIEYSFMDDLEDDEPAMLSAEDQTWDEATLKQLREEYNIIFMTGGDAVMPIMIINKETHPLLVIGHEDDGTICFDRQYGQYINKFSLYWVESLIADLKEAVNFSGYNPTIK